MAFVRLNKRHVMLCYVILDMIDLTDLLMDAWFLDFRNFSLIVYVVQIPILCQLLEQLRLPCCTCLYCTYIVYLTYLLRK